MGVIVIVDALVSSISGLGSDVVSGPGESVMVDSSITISSVILTVKVGILIIISSTVGGDVRIIL
jgi:hypothetical protein